MKTVITMAGKGRRFLENGYVQPKYKIEVNGKSLLEWSLSSLRHFYGSEFILIGRSDNWDDSFVHSVCSKLGIRNPQYILLDRDTDGRAATAISADYLMEPQDRVIIFNIDTYVDPDSLSEILTDHVEHGVIPVFSATGDKWSFVQEDDSGWVTQVVEKVRISQWATIGLYYFPEWLSFKNSFTKYQTEVRKEYGETYIAPLYQYLIDDGLRVSAPKIDPAKVNVLGTPEDLEFFY